MGGLHLNSQRGRLWLVQCYSQSQQEVWGRDVALLCCPPCGLSALQWLSMHSKNDGENKAPIQKSICLEIVDTTNQGKSGYVLLRR